MKTKVNLTQPEEHFEKPVLLIVDDEESVRESLRLTFQDDYQLFFAENAEATLRILKTQKFHLCLLDIMLPDGSGLDLLRQIKRREGSIGVIMVTALQGVETALNAMKGEAHDYITKPFKLDELRGLVKKVLAQQAAKQRKGFLKAEPRSQALCLTGHSKPLKNLIKDIDAAAASGEPICLIGEAGSGVEDVAREIHFRSRQKEGPFVTFACSTSSNEGQIEQELFGKEDKGNVRQIGKLEFADKGTLFLKQVDRIPLALQERLMAVLADQAMAGSESHFSKILNLRVMASTELHLASKAVHGLFTKEFYQFLKDGVILVPTLRERKTDIPLLIDRIIETENLKAKMSINAIQDDVIDLFVEYTWPGNITELENSIETMMRFASKATLTLEDIPVDVLIKEMDMGKVKRKVKLSLKKLCDQFESKYIKKVLENALGNQTQTAKILGLHRTTLVGKLKKLNLKEDYKGIVQRRRERGMGFRKA